MAKSNADFPQIIINSIPAPELLKPKATEKELLPYSLGLKELDSHNPDFIVMACNTIHIFREQLQQQTNAPIIDLQNEAKQFLLSKRIKKIVVFGSPLTINSGLFDFSGILSIKPTSKEQRQISKAVFCFNIGTQKQKQIRLLEKIAGKYSDKAVLLLACTEISLMLKKMKCSKVDTMDILLSAVLKRL